MKKATRSLSYVLLEKFLRIILLLPKTIRKITSSRIEIIISRFYEFLNCMYLSGYILTGYEKYSNEPLRLLYFGDGLTYNFLSNIFFSQKPDKKYIGKMFFWNAKKGLKKYKEDVDIFIIHTERFYSKYFQKKSFIVVPEWVNMLLDSSRDLDEICSSFSRGAKKDIKKIEKQGFTYELTNDPDKLLFFYNKMFLPYISSKHSLEIPRSYYIYVRYLMERDSVLLVKHDGKYVSGGLVGTVKDVDVLESMGIIDGNVDYLSKGASTALYYFHILSAKERGIKQLNYGDTRTFVRDGRFQFKRKWGMHVTISKFRFNIFCINFLNYKKSVESFLSNNPFIFLDGELLSCFVLSADKKPLNTNDLHHLFKMYYTPGFSQLCIFSKNGFSEDVNDFCIDGFVCKKLHSTFIGREFDIFVFTEKTCLEGVT